MGLPRLARFMPCMHCAGPALEGFDTDTSLAWCEPHLREDALLLTADKMSRFYRTLPKGGRRVVAPLLLEAMQAPMACA